MKSLDNVHNMWYMVKYHLVAGFPPASTYAGRPSILLYYKSFDVG